MEIKKLIEDSSKLKYYHGQIYKFLEFKKKEPKYFDITQLKKTPFELLKNILDNFKIDLYYHQGELIQKIFDEKKDAIICMNKGSGKGIAIDLCVILNVLMEHKTILYLRPFIADLEFRLNALKERIKKADWNWLIRAEKANNAEELNHFINKVPDIILTTPQTLADYYLTPYTIEKENIWFNSLNLLIIEDITSYTTEELFHLQNLISSLKLGQKNNFQILISSDEVKNPEILAHKITNRSVEAIKTDFSLKNQFKVFIWIPYLDSFPTEDNKLTVKRREYIKELEECIKILCKPNDNIFIWYLFGKIGQVELREIKDSLLEDLKDALPHIDISVFDDLRYVEKEKYRKFNKVFILGLNSSIESLCDTLGNLLCENGLAVIIPYENPISYFYIRSPELSGEVENQFPVLPDSNQLKKDYFLRSLCILPSFMVDKEKIFEIWGKDFSEVILSELQKENLIDKENEKISIINPNAIFEKCKNIHWGVLDKEVFALYTQEQNKKRTIYFGKYLFPYFIYPEAIYYHGLQKYLISPDIAKSFKELQLNYAGTKPVLTFPIIKHTIETKDNKENLVKELENFCKIVYFNDAKITAELLGRKSYDSLEYKENIVERYEESIKVERNTPIIKLILENPVYILHIFHIFLPQYIINFEKLFDLCADNEGIFILPIIPGLEKFLKEFYANSSTIIPKIYKNAYNLLITCPCYDGCPLCLKSIKFIDEVGGIKKDLIRTIAKCLKKEEEAEFIIRKKEKGLSEREAEKIYIKIRQKVLHLFKNKLELEIKNPAELKVEKMENASGLYSGNLVKVIPDIPEAFVYDVIAHEYAHNWEFENNNMCASLKGDKLVIEGFAQWVAFKILDFYGLADWMENIDLDEYNEYGDGFDLMKWIEDNVAGFYGVIDFVKNGKVIDPVKNIEYNLEKLLKDSGIGDKIKSRRSDDR